MFEQVLSPATLRNLESLGGQAWVPPFYLAGGTAVALQLGHRLSDDLDWFSSRSFQPATISKELSSLGRYEELEKKEGTLHGILDGIRVSFLHYPYPLLEPPLSCRGASIAGLRDLSCMKLEALSGRGRKRDFVDLYFIARSGLRLEDALQALQTKYAGVRLNPVTYLKALTYFADAENDPMPTMKNPASWDEIKAFFGKESRRLYSALFK